MQFDFGPIGGDVHVDGPLGNVLKEEMAISNAVHSQVVRTLQEREDPAGNKKKCVAAALSKD